MITKGTTLFHFLPGIDIPYEHFLSPHPLLLIEGFHWCYLLRQILLRFPLGLYEEQETMIGGSPGRGGTA